MFPTSPDTLLILNSLFEKFNILVSNVVLPFTDRLYVEILLDDILFINDLPEIFTLDVNDPTFIIFDEVEPDSDNEGKENEEDAEWLIYT